MRRERKKKEEEEKRTERCLGREKGGGEKLRVREMEINKQIQM